MRGHDRTRYAKLAKKGAKLNLIIELDLFDVPIEVNLYNELENAIKELMSNYPSIPYEFETQAKLTHSCEGNMED